MKLVGLSFAVLALPAVSSAEAQPVVGAPCDPNFRDPVQGNLNGCTGGLRCRWVTGSCTVSLPIGPTINFNGQCLDSPSRGQATASAPWLPMCSSCTGVTGQCEVLDVCNKDQDCLVRDHACVEGLCQFAPRPESLPGGGCTSDVSCQSTHGPLFRCSASVCVEAVGMKYWTAERAETGFRWGCDGDGECGRF